jgi:hypothetical protein
MLTHGGPDRLHSAFIEPRAAAPLPDGRGPEDSERFRTATVRERPIPLPLRLLTCAVQKIPSVSEPRP